MSLNFRLDIQGLRAFAVVAVVIEHTFPSVLSGGFVGVDVFFVISGFLISKIISRDIEESRFSILEFYSRRIRRIAPALFLVIASTVVVGLFLLSPKAFKELALTSLSTLLFVSNFAFARLSGYFDGSSMFKPLLHMWSLSVEEQFYLFFPAFMLLSWAKYSRKFNLILLISSTVFLIVIAELLRNYSVTAAYYLLPSRAFELLLGVLLGLGVFANPHSSEVRNIFSLVGLCLLIYSVLYFSPDTPFPGLMALVPCLGAALIIYSGGQGGQGGQGGLININEGVVVRLLSLRPIVYIGAISYSFYLWHWPILVFVRHFVGTQLSVFAGFSAVFVSFFAAALTYRYIERPFLRGGLWVEMRSNGMRSASVL